MCYKIIIVVNLNFKGLINIILGELSGCIEPLKL